MDMIHLPKGVAVRTYERPVEEAYLVLEGCLTVAWEGPDGSVEERLGPKDVILNPASQLRCFRNDGVDDAEFMMLVGTPQPEDIRFQPA
jgi:hypothetical protein